MNAHVKYIHKKKKEVRGGGGGNGGSKRSSEAHTPRKVQGRRLSSADWGTHQGFCQSR